MTIDVEEEKLLKQKISRVLDEARASHATHIRKLKDLSAIRSSSSSSSAQLFFSAFSKALVSLFKFHRRNASAERIVLFIANFASVRDGNNTVDSDVFLEEFLWFLVAATAASNKTVRCRACQIISEVAVKEERREARRAKKEIKELYKSEGQQAQKVAAFSGPSSIHLM